MIAESYIRDWKTMAPWPDWAHVEQDLVICRAMVEIFNHPLLKRSLLMRGGTVLHKCCFATPRRYSEDLDFVQAEKGPIGPLFDAFNEIMTPWLGKARRQQGPGVIHLTYRFISEIPPARPLKLKIEINSREHFSLMPPADLPFGVSSLWFEGKTAIRTFLLEELLATKLRALYQRRKGRDLFDLWLGITEGSANPSLVVGLFRQYMEREGHSISRSAFLENLAGKMSHSGFLADLSGLLVPGMTFDWEAGYQCIAKRLVGLLA